MFPPVRPSTVRSSVWSCLALAGFALILAACVPTRGGAASELARLPFFAFRSLLRMTAAYGLSLAFALAYGYACAVSKRAERILLPILDVLQSIPVVGFFPVAIGFFASLAPGVLGIELASVFLVFTGMAWNMAFGVYEGLSTIPPDLTEASGSFGVKGSLRIARLLFPAVIPKLVYNSIVSWAGGWYFLIASEIISVGGVQQTLPGLGSFLQATSERGQLGANLAGVATLIGVVVALDILFWRPLSAYADRFRYEQTATAPQEQSRILEWWLRSRAAHHLRGGLAAGLRAIVTPLALVARVIWSSLGRSPGRALAALRFLPFAVLGLVAVWTGWELLLGVRFLVRTPWPAEARQIPLALAASTGRLAAAYVLSLAWTIPVAVWAGSRPRVLRLVRPIAEVGASVPAIALFPLIVVLLIRVIGVNGASVLLVLTGMQWYLLFNLLSGVSAIPEDLREASRSIGLSWRQRFFKLELPAAAPSLMTGTITSWGGGWNALIVSEQLSYGGQTYTAFGIGALLDQATYQGKGDPVLLALSLISMVVTIVLLNHFVWRKLYAWSVERFRLEA